MQDQFERSSLGGNWTDQPLGGCVITGSSDATSTNVNAGTPQDYSSCFYNAYTPPLASYACVKLSSVVTQTEAGPCLAMDNTATYGKAVCCFADISNKWDAQALQQVVKWLEFENNTTPLFSTGDFLGIERDSDGTTYRCKRSTTGSSWSNLVNAFPVQVDFSVSTGASPGQAGMGILDSATGSTGGRIEQWEAGAGTLPTGHTCGQ